MVFYRNSLVSLVAIIVSTVVFAGDETRSSRAPAVQQTLAAQQVAVPVSVPSTPIVVQDTKVNINTAAIKELMEVKGMSRVKAKNIITYRKKHGNFKSLDELKLVKGFQKIKDENLKLIQGQLSVD